MTGAKIDVFLLEKINIASEVRTNRIEGLDLVANRIGREYVTIGLLVKDTGDIAVLVKFDADESVF